MINNITKNLKAIWIFLIGDFVRFLFASIPFIVLLGNDYEKSPDNIAVYSLVMSFGVFVFGIIYCISLF